MEQDFTNFEKIYLSTAIPNSGFPYYDCCKNNDFLVNDDKFFVKKNSCVTPKKEDIKEQKSEN